MACVSSAVDSVSLIRKSPRKQSEFFIINKARIASSVVYYELH